MTEFETITTIKRLLANGCVGNRWFCVNLHVHGEGNDPLEIVAKAREAKIDLIAVTDHQSFSYVDKIQAAAETPGRPLVVLPGIEITAEEGPHLLAIFPKAFSGTRYTEFLGYLEIDGRGDTSISSKRQVDEIFTKVEELGGIIVVPHPLTDDIGLLARARKMNIKEEWLESGHVHLMQIDPEKVKYIGHDDEGNWVNRHVLHSSRPQDIETSGYCLAPLNRSDAHRPAEISDGISWLRMTAATIDGLKQVACEPRTRISRVPPTESGHPAILCASIKGGYCDGQQFDFNGGLSVLIGANHAGKSAILDFIRFGLNDETRLPPDESERFLQRLNAILQPDGLIELICRQNKGCYVIRRTFKPEYKLGAQTPTVVRSTEPATTYVYDVTTESLNPAPAFQFPIEVYEQGRIHRLREDLNRQLDMLDEFAGLKRQRSEREHLIDELDTSAEFLQPLREEQEQLRSEVSQLDQLKGELADKEKALPGDEHQVWAKSQNLVQMLRNVSDQLAGSSGQLSKIVGNKRSSAQSEFSTLFGQEAPPFPAGDMAERELFQDWHADLKKTIDGLGQIARDVCAVVNDYTKRAIASGKAWELKQSEYRKGLAVKLKAASVESPQELLSQIENLRQKITGIEQNKLPRLTEVTSQVAVAEQGRAKLLHELSEIEDELRQTRSRKAKELTESLGGQIRIEVEAGADRNGYVDVLDELSKTVTGGSRRIPNRETQLKLIVQKVLPRELADALANNGVLNSADGTSKTLVEKCAITENTQNVLCAIASDTRKLNKLQTAIVSEGLRILVRRHGENNWAELRKGLSPGEQSAAILTMALQTRTMPLIVDQPEDELGYSYVVHRIVPKILESKASRQIIMVTHNANIPVLGDADYVIQMRNEPAESGDRRCVVAGAGCFESPAITEALLALEGGREAFRFRQHRYSLPRNRALKMPYMGEVQ